jgi:AcrR family transcriptional regulator
MQELLEAAPDDGRAARALRTRNAVVDALLDLIDEGQVRPSAAHVAQRAGVSLRSVYQHFDDLETLFRVAAERHQQRFAHLEPLPELPSELGSRIRAFVAHRAVWMEAVSPMGRAAALQAPFSEGVADRLAGRRRRHRDTLAATFAPELARAADADRLLHAIEMATTWSTWESLRAGQGLAPEAAAAVVELTLLRLLDQPQP